MSAATTALIRRLRAVIPKKFLQYYSANGSDTTGIKPGSSTIIRESAFTEEANPELVAAYPTYRDYLFGEHLLQYPAAYGALLRDGKANTHLIGGLRFVDIHGESVPRYPAAAAALDYGVTVEGATTGLEAGAWWLPSVDEVYLLMHDRVLTSADRESDPVNRTLSRLGKTTCYGSGLLSVDIVRVQFLRRVRLRRQHGRREQQLQVWHVRRASGFRFVKTVFSF